MIAAIVVPVLIVAGGMAIDLGRLHNARSHAQDVVDAAALQGAASGETNRNRLRTQAQNYIDNSLNPGLVRRTSAVRVNIRNGNQVDVSFDGQTPAMFGAFFGISQMNVSVTAATERSVNDQLEIALVLDTTDSMNETDANGVQKIVALRSAAETLVTTVANQAGNRASFALVPYADYVNVGTQYRGQSWLSVPPDRTDTTPGSPATCRTISTQTTCSGGTQTTCTGYRDGVPYSYSCTQGQTCTTTNVTPYQQCSAATPPTTTAYRWYGCVRSRTVGSLRLDDTQPSTPYPGWVDTQQRCPRPLVTLTNTSSTVVSAIRALTAGSSGYAPDTYIPSGMIWGVNTLSPTAPFTATAYDPRNRRPRKVLVLMTDGANTLQFQSSDGQHVGVWPPLQSRPEIQRTNADTLAICDYAKRQNIEVYTVALAVNLPEAQTMLRSCASAPQNYFDARNSTDLANAFLAIAASINTVRLVR